MTDGTGRSNPYPGSDEPTVFRRPAGYEQPPAQGAAQPGYGQPQQPGYGQPQYGDPQPGYGQSQYAAPPAAYGGSPRGSGRSFGVTSIVFTVLGAAAAVVGLFVLKWLRTDGSRDFLEIRKNANSLGDSFMWTKTYFVWAAFVLLAVALICAIVAALPTGATPAFRAIGALVSLVGLAYTLGGRGLDTTEGFGDYLKNGLGMYAVAGGFLLFAIGALIGSRRRR